MPDTRADDAATSTASRARELFAEARHTIYSSTNRLFAGLMGFQWLAGIAFALWVSPLAWEGPVSRTHLHVWAAVLLGGLISLFPALLGLLRPGRSSTRYTIAIGQMLMGALLIHLTGGRLETHFHVFGSLAFLAFYRDWRVLVPATIVVALDHLLRGIFWPQSVYGVLVASQWRWLEHAAWVLFEDIFLVVSCLRSLAEMRQTAERTATLEQEVRTRQQAEIDARNARARNDAILNVALDCVVLMDASGRIVQFNPAAERTFGYRATEAVGAEIADLIVPAVQRDADRRALTRNLTTGDSVMLNRRFELVAVRKGGEAFPMEVAIAPISSDGAPMFAGYMRDITERQRAERALAERMSLASMTAVVGLALTRGTAVRDMLQQCADAIRLHVEGGVVGIWTLNEDAHTLSLQASAGLAGAVEAGSDVVVGWSTIGQVAADRTPRVMPIADVRWESPDSPWARGSGAAFAGYPLQLDSKFVGVLVVIARHAFSSSALSTIAAVADGLALGIERKRANRELERYTQELESAHATERQNAEQLAALVEQVRMTQRQAEAATRAKSDFLASMSHELRTPLNAIILYSELLQEEADDQGDHRSIADLQKIQSSGKHLLDLINGILDLSKIEAGKMTVAAETFDVRAMIDELLDTVHPLVNKNGNTLTVHCDQAVSTARSDLMKIRQILLNLLSNASKFTRDGTIRLDVGLCEIGGRRAIEFVVTDTGVGMTEEQAGKIFEAFTQADVTTTRKYGGTGLGLAIVSRFCSLMHGTIAVQSRLGEGSRFIVRLPLAMDDHALEVLTPADAVSIA